MNYKDKFNAQMKKAGINSLDDLKSDAEKKAFFKAVDKSHDAKNEELLTFAEEAINEFKLKDSDIEKLKQGVKQMPPMKGAKLGKPEKVKTADEEYVEEAMKKEMAKKEMMMKAMKTGEADAEPNAEMLNAMVKDPHKSKEDKPMKDMNAMYMKSDVRADVKNNGGADMAKVKDAPKMQTAMKKINAMYKTEKYLQTKDGSINDAVAQMQVNEMKTVTVRVKEFSQMVETYLARGGVKGFINTELTEGKQVLPLKEVRTFIDTYNRHFLTNYRAEEFIVRDRLNEKKASYIDVKFNSSMDAKRMMAWLDKNISHVNNQLYDGAYREGQSIIQFEDVPNVDALMKKLKSARINFKVDTMKEEIMNEGSVTGLPKDRAIMYIIKTDRSTARRIKSFLADNGERYSMHIDDDDSGQITLDAYGKQDKDDAYDAAHAIAKKFNVKVRGTR